MLLKFRLGFLSAIALLILSSCHRVPKHARYVPKDAFMVLGLHTGEMRKELAWSAITGSNILDEMRKAGSGGTAPEALKEIEHSGIDFGSALYFYAKPDTRFAKSMKLAAILPVADEAELTAYVKKHFPNLSIISNGGRNEVFVDKQIGLSWNNEVLIAISPIVRKVEHKEETGVDSIGGENLSGGGYSWTEEIADPSATSQELAALFQPVKSSGINEVSRFTDMENGNHDITFWMNYDALMDLYSAHGGDVPGIGMMGVTMGNTMFKGSAMASGFDFEKGRVDGLMRYYASDSMKRVAQEFGKESIDGDMLRRLPAEGLNMAAGYHLSPAVIKLMLEKMNLSGMANLALMSQGVTLDDVLGGFTGDMVVAVNNFRVTQEAQKTDSAAQEEYGMRPYPATKPSMDFVYAMEIGDKTKLMKLFSLFGKNEMLRQTAPNTYSVFGAKGSLVVGDKYVAVSSNTAAAQSFLKEHAGAMPDAVHKEISGHPIGIWADIHSFLAAGSVLARSSPSDSAAFSVVRNVFTTVSANGGEYKSDGNEYRITLGFVNKDENSLLQILQLAQRLSALNAKKAEVASR